MLSVIKRLFHREKNSVEISSCDRLVMTSRAYLWDIHHNRMWFYRAGSFRRVKHLDWTAASQNGLRILELRPKVYIEVLDHPLGVPYLYRYRPGKNPPFPLLG